MEINRASIEEIVFQAIDRINSQGDREFQIQKMPGFPLSGAASSLDSLDLISMMTATEQLVEERLGLTIALANEGSMSPHESPFATVESFTDHLFSVVEKKRGV